MMASQKVRPPALQRLFKTLTYNMYVKVLNNHYAFGDEIFA